MVDESERHGVVFEVESDRVGVSVNCSLYWLRPERLVRRAPEGVPF